MAVADNKIVVTQYRPEQAAEWKAFLEASNNGTLFHDLDFLSYHQKGRFHEHHLMFYRTGKLAGLLPAAIVSEADGRRLMKSPYGASVGGLVVPQDMKLQVILNMISALQSYAEGLGLKGIEMRIGPITYLLQPSNLLDFALMSRSFHLAQRWLTFMIPLDKFQCDPVEKLFSKTKKYDVRANLGKGLKPREVGIELLDTFYELLAETLARHNATPTHQENEIADIFQRVRGRVRLFLCAYEDREIAGVLVFMLNRTVAYTFYICESEEFKRMCGAAVLIAHIIEQMAREGLLYLDLGPSASSQHVNEGVVFFKESLGAIGFCRETWRWDADESA